MSLEVLNTAGTLATVVIVAATAIAALVQLRHLRASNQINAMLTIGERVEAKPIQDAINLLGSALPAAMDSEDFQRYFTATVLLVKPEHVEAAYVELVKAVRLVGNTFEDLGILLERRVIDRDIFLRSYAGLILVVWEVMKSSVVLVRGAGKDAAWIFLEYLAVESEDWKQEHPNPYPRGVRRIIPNPTAAH